MKNEQKMDLEMLSVEDAAEVSGKILERTIKGMGFAPNLYSLMANNPALLDAYTHSYETFRKNGGLSPVEQEVVLLSAAAENECHYCVAAHSFVADKMSNVPTEVTDAIRSDEVINDPKLSALSKFTRQVVKQRGWIEKNDLTAFFESGYDQKAVLAVITGIGVKTMSNYFNHIMHTPLDEAFLERKWESK